ncbi:MAG: bifunctional precorrin-2 dehydrogenase/sirohydrochlorin ferrochelatase, partial [Armatimonadota bacterium]
MTYLPVNINLKNKNCLVAGAGKVALHKIKILLKFGADIKVVAPAQDKEVLRLFRNSKIKLIKRKFTASDLKNIHLVIAATSSRETNKKISELTRRKNILINVVDDAQLSSFIMPAIIKSGDLNIGISTSGKSPALSLAL